VLLGDNARALVLGRDRATGTVTFNPAISPSVGIGTCSRAPARRIGRGPKARRKRA
jgi:hypothetical protein